MYIGIRKDCFKFPIFGDLYYEDVTVLLQNISSHALYNPFNYTLVSSGIFPFHKL